MAKIFNGQKFSVHGKLHVLMATHCEKGFDVSVEIALCYENMTLRPICAVMWDNGTKTIQWLYCPLLILFMC